MAIYGLMSVGLLLPIMQSKCSIKILFKHVVTDITNLKACISFIYKICLNSLTTKEKGKNNFENFKTYNFKTS